MVREHQPYCSRSQIRPSGRTVELALALALSSSVDVGCISSATQIQLLIDTDAPANRAMTVEVFSFAGSVAPQDLLRRANAVSTGNLRLLRDSAGAGTFVAGGSIGVLPPRANRDGRESTVTLWIRAVVAATPMSPEVRVDRAVTFQFIVNRAGTARVFLSVRCGAQQVGCLTVPAAVCTQSIICRERNETCGDMGECVPPTVPVEFASMDGGRMDGTTGASDSAADVPNRPRCDGGNCVIDCPAPNQICGAGAMMTCVNTRSDNNNCGACGNSCMVGTTCQGGSCSCPAGTTLCAGTCVDLSNSATNCGMCGNTCTGGTTCSAGACMCPGGSMLCGGACINTSSDRNNCGSCGRTCAADRSCSGGMCLCAPGMTGCNPTCRNLSNDNANCGACGTVCGGGTSCGGGTCVCPAAQSACGGVCVALGTDDANCGSCARACAADRNCSGGMCLCAAGTTSCGGPCRNLSNDESNCGMCGRNCAGYTNAQPFCAGGSCVLGACNALWGNCDASEANGCETSLSTNMSNCGACRSVCPAGRMCRGGVCA